MGKKNTLLRICYILENILSVKTHIFPLGALNYTDKIFIFSSVLLMLRN